MGAVKVRQSLSVNWRGQLTFSHGEKNGWTLEGQKAHNYPDG